MSTEPKIGTWTQTPGLLAGVQSVRFNKIAVTDFNENSVSIAAMSEDGMHGYRGWKTRREWDLF